MTDNTPVVVTDNPDESRFEARVDDTLAGRIEYALGAATIDFQHTIVDDAFEGRGVGSALVQQALDAVRADGRRKVIPTCPFVRRWIHRHPDYQDLLA